MIRRLAFAVVVWSLLSGVLAVAGDDMKPEEVLQRHLDSIGKPEARAAAKTRVIQGMATYKVLQGGSGQIDGKVVMVSEQRKVHLMLKINAQQYHGEKFLANGEKTFVTATYTDKSRSEFGEFLRSQDVPLREGLMGGVWSTDWPLLDLDGRKAKLAYEGKKTIDGHELIAVGYRPKKGSDLRITLYFDRETFRHVLTIYQVSRAAGLGSVSFETNEGAVISQGASETMSARQNESRYRIEERYSNFKVYDGLTLPSTYDLRFTEELQSGFTKTVEWETTAAEIQHNVPLDDKNFEIP
jgi:hypothetical protein